MSVLRHYKEDNMKHTLFMNIGVLRRNYGVRGISPKKKIHKGHVHMRW